ncbi:Ig-like domain-containing protein [Actinoplanes sp. N902-109]|uniref:L,D-transpeptidase n=1 Tax=Actinoplanes sp. (strain N902-109) TaxID=649831 RepID=UPI0003295247|nr:Ig-like domain-containing protein [Actinoplanes sp. N902-109]AGL14842.1 ErfK/YbiS/YcfS/YnhG family protein [Actinoplanes sp. N902-109]
MRLRGATGGAGQRRWRTAAVALATATVLVVAGCSGGKDDASSPSWQGSGQSGGASASPQPPASTVAVTAPEADATDVKAITTIKYDSDDPANTSVTVTDPEGDQIQGTLDKDDKTFTPASALKWGKTYTVTVNGTASGDKVGTSTSKFTVMKKPSQLVRVSSFLGDGMKVGVGMPMIIKFGRSVPKSYRAEVERRMVVSATPEQEGSWYWISGTEMHYRPKVFWKANTKIHYKVALAGVEMDKGWYGRSDLTVDLNVGRSFIMVADAKNKQMTVTQDGKVIKKLPISLGKPSTPSSSGTAVIIEKKEHTVFDTMDELPEGEGYRTKIDYAQRYTWGGEFVHAASWSEGVQGKQNVSHGCVNVSEAMGKWLFDRTMMGDVVQVKGTPRKLQWNNGWTDWELSWDQYKKGSAL